MFRKTPEPARYVAPWAGVEVLTMSVDKNLDVIVRHRVRGNVKKSIVRYDENNDRYFWAAHQRIYLEDLRQCKNKVVSCAG